MQNLINTLCAPGSAAAPRAKTDRLFQLPAGFARFEGPMMDAIRFIEGWQLLDGPLWALFVNQFRSNVDDADRGWRCEYWGKMMRGAAFTYRCTGTPELYDAMAATVSDLLSVQEADGRFSTYSREKEFDGWDIWGRKYILLGLQYFMEICPDEALKARCLTAMIRHADYIIARIGPEAEGKLEINKATSHWGGLNSSSVLEPFVRLYSLTGEMRYLEFADYIVARGGCDLGNIFELAYEGRLYPYQYPVVKAYEMMSCFEGLLEYYRVTGVEKWRVAAENFARLVYQSDVTLIGCSGCTHELFDHSSVRQLDVTEKGIIQETCVTVTWMKLCYQLLCLTGDSFFADCIEQSSYNALLGAVNTEKCTVNKGLPFDSYSPILPGTRGRATGGYKEMENGTYYGCCACIGAAGLGLAGMHAVMLSRDGAAVNAYMKGVYAVAEGLSLEMDTAYPADGAVKIVVHADRPTAFTLSLRVPAWSGNTAVSVNGAACARVVAGSYYRVEREWREGDAVALSFDMSVRRVTPEDYKVSSDDAPYAAWMRGPLVLAADARLGTDVDAPVSPACDCAADAEEARIPCIVACDLPLTDGALRMVDYSSAGKTWTEASRMAAWIPLRK